VSEQEQWFDDEIAPALMALANRCRERGMAVVASVEYEPGKRSSTIAMPDGAGLAMQFQRLCANAGENIDGYMFAVQKFCHANNVPTDASLVMRRVFASA
jgi:hypothetical protein